MSFSVEVLSGSVQVEPGSTVPGAVTVVNHSSDPVEFEIVLEGLDGEWTAVPVPVFVLAPGASQTERYFLKPPRTPESAAATYPYAVTVRSLETGEMKKIPAVLEVKPFHHLTVDFNPRRIAVAYNRGALVEATVANLGNSEHRVQLFAADQDNLFAFEFESAEHLLGSGQAKKVPLILSATKPSLLSNTRISPFSVSVRSIQTPSVAGVAQGTAEQKALLTPGSFIAFLVFIFMAALWWAFLPRAPRLDAFSVSQSEIIAGEAIVLSWSSQHASYVRLKVGEEEAMRMPQSGQHEVTPREPGTLNIQASAMRDGRESTVSYVRVEVKPPPKAPLPVISRFEVSPRRIRLGEGVLVRFDLSPSVKTAALEPFAATIDPRATSFQVTPTIAGTVTIKLIARNEDGVAVEKSESVTVSDESMAKINRFTISPKSVRDGAGEVVTVSWIFEGAYKAELNAGGVITPLAAATGSQEIVVNQTTKVTVTVWDAQGRSVAQSSTVQARKPDPPAPVDPVPDPAAATSGGTAGAGSGPGPNPPPSTGP
jgi:hypothetical protein